MREFPLIHGLVVYGKTYCDLMQRFFLPSLLAPGNLPAVSQKNRDRFIIYTSSADAQFLKKMPRVLQQIEAYVSVEFVIIDEAIKEFSISTKIVNHCHRLALTEALKTDAGHCIWCPDFMVSNGFLAGVLRHVDAGARAVLISANRANREKIVEKIEEFRSFDGALMIDSRKLVNLVLQNPHPGNTLNEIQSPRSSPYPSGAIWPVKDEGWIIMAWMHHPIYVRPRDARVLNFTGSVDGDLINLVCSAKEIAIIQDSDADGVCVELSPITHGIDFTDGRLTAERMALWAKNYAHDIAHYAVHQPIKIIAKYTPELWAVVSESLEVFKKDVFCYLQKIQERDQLILKTFEKKPFHLLSQALLGPAEAAILLKHLNQEGITRRTVRQRFGWQAALTYGLIRLFVCTDFFSRIKNKVC